MTYGEKIADLRKKRGMTQDDLGKAMNVSYQAVSKWERGESQPDFDTMSKIAKLFGVPIGYFEEGGELQQENAPEEPKSEEAPEELKSEKAPEETKTEEAPEEPEKETPNEANEQPKEEPKAEKEVNAAPPIVHIGVCTVCGRMLKENEAQTTIPKIVCKACTERQKREAQQRAERQKQEAYRKKEAEAREVIGHGFDATLIVSLILSIIGYIVFAVITFQNLGSDELLAYGGLLFFVPLALFGITHAISGAVKEWRDRDDETEYSLVVSLIVGAVYSVMHIALFLVLCLSADSADAGILWGMLVGGAFLTFTFVSQFLWGSPIKAVFTAGGFTFKLPGFIITLDIDSILWMIVTKIFLGILSVIVFVLTTVFVAALAIVGSVFFFIPCLLIKVGKDQKARNSLKA